MKRKLSAKKKFVPVFLVLCLMLTLTLMSMTAMAADTDITSKFTDPIFRDAVRNELGIGPTDPIYDTAVAALIYLDVSGLGITSLDGIECFTSLEVLFCSDNQLSNLDLSGLSSLELLWCEDNELPSLDLTGLGSLEYLYCYANQLPSLDLSSLTGLAYLNCSDNQLTSLDLTSCIGSLTDLYCSNNYMNNPETDILGFASRNLTDYQIIPQNTPGSNDASIP